MLKIFDVSYNTLSEKKSEELYSLRKQVFKDRLNWAVNCINGLEFDEYDNPHANYLFGVIGDQIICGSRLIEMKYPTMITGTFAHYFNQLPLYLPKGNYIESSRFFVDKSRAYRNTPISLLLFLATINYSIKHHYDGILTIVSQGMLSIMMRSGWQFSVIAEGVSEKNKSIFLLQLPTDIQNQQRLIDNIEKHTSIKNNELSSWPIIFSLTEKPV